MKCFVALTKHEWFNFLKARKVDEANFWRPSGKAFKSLEIGQPFLFKLHAPLNYIVGGGFFVRYTKLPLTLVWKVFGEKNGAPSFEEFRTDIFQSGNFDSRLNPDPEIGCIVLAMPVFLDEKDWFPVPEWKHGIQSGRGYNPTQPGWRELWSRSMQFLMKSSQLTSPSVSEPITEARTRYLVEARLGQGAFRSIVIDSYNKRCAVSGERTVPVLEAAHIKPYADKGPNRLSNGLLLRSDLHILFDAGLVTVTKDLKVEVSRKIREEYENGRDYYRYHGQSLVVLPSEASSRPANEFLEWHHENVYRG